MAVTTMMGFAILEVAFALTNVMYGGAYPAIPPVCFAAQSAIALYLTIRLWNRDDRVALVFLLLAAVALRVPAFASRPALSNDAYRYVWDGELLLHGVDPHAVTPESPEAAGLRTTWLWPHIDYRTIPTIYPPLALGLFAAGALDANDLFGVKTVAVAGDAIACFAVLSVLRRRNIPRGRAALYALHPLVALEFAGNAHIEAWAIAGTVFACAGAGSGVLSRWRPAALAGAVLVKIYPAVVAPVVFARDRAALAITAAVVAITYLPELLHGHAFGSAANYLGQQRFNGSLGSFFGSAGELAGVAVALVFAWIFVRRGGDVAIGTGGVVLAYLIFSPNVLPWYVLVLPALVCVASSPFEGRMRPIAIGVVAWSFSVAISYGAPSLWPDGSPLGIAMRCVEYAPLYAGLAIAALAARSGAAAHRVAA